MNWQDYIPSTEGKETYDLDGLSYKKLPASKSEAYKWIEECTDINLLEEYMDNEDRDSVIDFIDDRIDELEDGLHCDGNVQSLKDYVV